MILNSFEDFGRDLSIADRIGDAEFEELESIGTGTGNESIEPHGFVLIIFVSFFGDEKLGSVRFGEGGSPSVPTGDEEEICNSIFIDYVNLKFGLVRVKKKNKFLNRSQWR